MNGVDRETARLIGRLGEEMSLQRHEKFRKGLAGGTAPGKPEVRAHAGMSAMPARTGAGRVRRSPIGIVPVFSWKVEFGI